ncbi:unnamed protein product [Scytosiphon promiscuus]
MNTTVTTNRHKDTMRWRTLALQYEMKISYLERALAQEESKLRIAEQVHREEGLELHLEMVSRQRGQTRDGTKSASMQEELAALCSKLSASNARVVIMENSKAKLEQELASEKLHEEELAVSKRQLIELREANAEEAGRSEFEIKKLKGDLDIANQKSKARTCMARSAGGDERAATSQARMEALREEQEQIIAEAKYEKEAAQEVLEHTVQTFEMQLKEAAKLKTENGNLISELEKEVERLSARCKDLVEHREITSEERARIENALRQQHRLADEQRMKETAAHLADLEAEKQSLLSRVLEAEAETDRQRRAADDLVLVLEEAKTAQSALQAAAATQRAEASVRASKPERRDDEAKAAERAARAKADDLERDLSRANKRVEDLEKELTTAEQVAKDAADVKKRAKEEVERAALAEEQARAAVEEARAAAADGPNEHEQEMFRAEAILKAAVHELQGRLETTEDEVDLLHDELAGAQGSVDELEEEVEELLDSRAKMRVEVHEAHCQIQRMTVERSSLRREGAEAADMLTNAEALLREVTGCIDRTEHEGTHSKVVEILSAMRRRKVDERAVKMNRARDRIEAENRARVEKALSAMRRLGRGSNSPGAGGDDLENIARRLESAPEHLRPILAVFLSPGFKKAFLAYAEQVARGEVAFPSATGAVTKQAGSLAGSSGSTGDASARGNPPPRRAISLDYPVTCPGHEAATPAAAAAAAAVPALARGVERRRQVAFGDAPPSKSEASMMADGKRRLSMGEPGGRNGGTGVKRDEWHKHREGSDFDVTLTADTASGRAANRPSLGSSAGAVAGATESGDARYTDPSATAAAVAAATAKAAAEAVAVRARQLKTQRKELKKREDGLRERSRLQEEIQREMERKSDEVEAEAAKIVQPGPEKDRLEEALRAAILELEAGAARMEELCRLSAETAAARQEAEQAYASATIEEAEAATVAERAAAAARRRRSRVGTTTPRSANGGAVTPPGDANAGTEDGGLLTASAAATAASGFLPHPITADKATEELEMLADSKAEAVKRLAGTSLESMLAAMELLVKPRADLNGDATNSIDDEAMKKQLRSNIASADIVEVSVALAEALILEREGSALLSRQPRARLDADQSLEKNRRGDPSMLPNASPASATRSTEGIDGIWSTQKAAENERRLALLSESLETSDIHDLQILRRSLQRQADDSAPRPRSQESRSRREGANRSRGGKARRSVGATATATPSEVPAVDEDERWQADILGERLAAVTRAVEKKGGWRSAVFLDKSGSQVNVDVDVEPWPAAEGVLMLQTVKDALYTRSKVEELEDVAALVSGRDELETHLEAAADLHRAVALLWEGVGNVLDSAPEDKRTSTAEATTSEPSVAANSRGLVPGTAGAPAERFAGAPDTDQARGNSTIPTTGGSDAVLVVIRDEESRDTPMHLEGLPLPTVTNALSLDVGKIRASTKLLLPPLLPRSPPSRAFPPRCVPSEPERTSPPESDREIISAPGSDQVASGEGEGEQRRAPSMTPSAGQGAPEAVGEEDRDPKTGATARTETSEEEPREEVEPPPPIPEEMTPPVEGGATQEELDEAWERAREMEGTARGLREVVEERGGVIGLLQREVEDLKAALADAEARMSDVPVVTPTPAVDPRLKQELQQAMSALGDERAFLADTTQKLDTSLQERERLLEDVAESKVKEQQLETLLQEVCGREVQLVAEIKRLQEAADGATLERLDAQIEEDPGLDEPALEDLRSKRRQKAKNVADTNGRLKVARSQHDDMWERAMNSYKWVHHLPQISVKNRTYKSIQEWIEAEIADQRKERKRLERAARLRFQKMEPRSFMYSRDQPPFSTGSVAPVVVTPLGLSSRSKTTTRCMILGMTQTCMRVQKKTLKTDRPWKHNLSFDRETSRQSRTVTRAQIQDERRTYESRSAFDFYRDNQPSQQSSSRSGGGPSSTPPALTVSIPSPPLEKAPTLPQPTPTRGKGAVGLNSAGYDSVLGPRNGGRAASFQRYKSLFTNAPAELPAVTVLPAGGGDDRPSAGSASPPHRTVNAGDPVGADVHQPASYRRAQTAKIDYHNPVRRKSSNTSFTHPVGHPGGLNAAVQFRSQPDSLRAWGDGQADAASAETSGSPDALSRKRRVNTPVDGGRAATDREEPFRWIPGAHGDRRPIVHSRWATKSRKSANINENNVARDSSSTRGPTATPAGAAVAAHGAPGSASSASSGEAAATADRFAKGKATPSSGLTRGRGGWVDPRGSSLPSPTNTASSSGLPRQLAVPGSLIVAEEGAGVTGGGFANTAGGLPSSADRRRLRHSMSAASGGGRRQPGGATSGARREAEVNNLHPAWRPKGLTRRQRATSVIRRG